MKNLLLLLCFLPISLGKEVHDGDLIERDGLLYEKFTVNPYTGSVYTDYILKYADDERVKNGEIVNGLKEGFWQKYWRNGNLYSP